MSVRLYMVPIYIKVDSEYDHAITLCGALNFMEDHSDGMFTDTEHMIDCGEQHGNDVPEELRDE